MTFSVFHRTWWKENKAWPGGKEPGAGEKHYIARYVPTADMAREICEEWNKQHDPGFLSDKAEFEEN